MLLLDLLRPPINVERSKLTRCADCGRYVRYTKATISFFSLAEIIRLGSGIQIWRIFLQIYLIYCNLPFRSNQCVRAFTCWERRGVAGMLTSSRRMPLCARPLYQIRVGPGIPKIKTKLHCLRVNLLHLTMCHNTTCFIE